MRKTYIKLRQLQICMFLFISLLSLFTLLISISCRSLSLSRLIFISLLTFKSLLSSLQSLSLSLHLFIAFSCLSPFLSSQMSLSHLRCLSLFFSQRQWQCVVCVVFVCCVMLWCCVLLWLYCAVPCWSEWCVCLWVSFFFSFFLH